MLNHIWWLSVMVWSILDVGRADQIKTAKVTVKEGTQKDELILDLIQVGQNLFPNDNIERQFVQSETSTDIFKVLPDGQVVLKKNLDREALCGKSETCTFSSIVSVLPQVVYQKIAVEVNVKDENDNAPIFNQSASENGMITIEVAENSEIGKRIEMNILRAVDEDPGLFGDIEYKITGENGVQFELVNENFRTYMIPRSELDRETNPHWIGTVTARDGGGRQAKTRLKVVLTDENDNAPRFTGTRFVASVAEGKPAGTFVYQVEAMDPDAAENGHVTYKIVRTEPDTASELFTIDKDTGYISTDAEIDRETYERVVLTIEATDSGEDALQAECQVTVSITDENDHAPAVTVTPISEKILNGESYASIEENEKIGTFISFVTITDGDMGSNGRFVAAVRPKDKFKLEADSYGSDSLILMTKKVFDREEKEFHNATITACDEGTPKKCTAVSFAVIVNDKNDNKPTFAEAKINVSLDENISIGSTVTTVAANDLDSSELYGKISYRLTGSGSEDFLIDAFTGVITVNRDIDYETRKSYNLTVHAEDGGGLSDSAELLIEVENLNDNLPNIQAADIVYLDNGLSSGDVIIDLKPYDLDGPEPIIQMSGSNADRFKLDGSLLRLGDEFNGDRDSLIKITLSDADDLASIVEFELEILAPRNTALIIVGVCCGILIVILIVVLFVMKFCNYERYKLQNQFNSLRRGSLEGQMQPTISQKTITEDNYSRSDYIITASEKLGKSSSHSDCSVGIHSVGHHHDLIGRKPIKKNDSDSGRGESESETHSRNHHKTSNTQVHLGEWCQTECLTLGHSDQCWLPQAPRNHAYEVEVRGKLLTEQPSSLSVWDRTSDYSSHSNRSSEKITDTKPKTFHTSKPCFV